MTLNVFLSRIISVTFVNTEKSRLCLPLGTYKVLLHFRLIIYQALQNVCLNLSTFTLSCSGLSFRAIVRVGAKGDLGILRNLRVRKRRTEKEIEVENLLFSGPMDLKT